MAASVVGVGAGVVPAVGVVDAAVAAAEVDVVVVAGGLVGAGKGFDDVEADVEVGVGGDAVVDAGEVEAAAECS